MYPEFSPCRDFNTLRPRQNGRHFPDDSFNTFSWMKMNKFQLKLHLHQRRQAAELWHDSHTAKQKHWNTTGAFTRRHACSQQTCNCCRPGGNLVLNLNCHEAQAVASSFLWRTLTSGPTAGCTAIFHKYRCYIKYGVIITPPTQQSCWGVYWFHSVRPFVRPSHIPCLHCSAYSSGWIHFIFIHLINQLQKVCRV